MGRPKGAPSAFLTLSQNITLKYSLHLRYETPEFLHIICIAVIAHRLL
jgi:hypothetical protein